MREVLDTQQGFESVSEFWFLVYRQLLVVFFFYFGLEGQRFVSILGTGFIRMFQGFAFIGEILGFYIQWGDYGFLCLQQRFQGFVFIGEISGVCVLVSRQEGVFICTGVFQVLGRCLELVFGCGEVGMVFYFEFLGLGLGMCVEKMRRKEFVQQIVQVLQ